MALALFNTIGTPSIGCISLKPPKRVDEPAASRMPAIEEGTARTTDVALVKAALVGAAPVSAAPVGTAPVSATRSDPA